MSNRLRIVYFTDEEDSLISPWTGRAVWEAEIDRKFKNKPATQRYIWIDTQRIHSFLTSDGRRFDAINGWHVGNHWLAQYEEYLANGPYCPGCFAKIIECECKNRCKNCSSILEYVQLPNRDSYVCPACGWSK